MMRPHPEILRALIICHAVIAQPERQAPQREHPSQLEDRLTSKRCLVAALNLKEQQKCSSD